MSEVVGSVSQWESEEIEYQTRTVTIKEPHWLKFTSEFISNKLDISNNEFVRRATVLQIYYELTTRDLLVKLEHESIEQAVLRFYKTSLKEHDYYVNISDGTSLE